MRDEVYAFTDEFDTVYNLSVDVSRAFGKKIPVNMFTDSKQFFDIITRGTRPTKKRLAIDNTVPEKRITSSILAASGQ